MEEFDKEETRKIAYNCRKATFLIEKKQLAKINIREKLELKMHLAGCSVCRVFEQQSIVINRLVKDMFQKPGHGNGLTLDDNFKEILQQKIEEKLNK